MGEDVPDLVDLGLSVPVAQMLEGLPFQRRVVDVEPFGFEVGVFDRGQEVKPGLALSILFKRIREVVVAGHHKMVDFGKLGSVVTDPLYSSCLL